MNIWAIIPVKPLNRSKSRLSPIVSPEGRESLSRQMLERTLVTLKGVRDISGILLISRDTSALTLGRKYGAQTLTESGAPELNASLNRATQVVSTYNASGILLVASDVPLMSRIDIERMISLSKESPSLVIASDRHQKGTNAMLVRPPGLITYRFGEDSFQKHVAEAREMGAVVSIYRSKTIELDVDTPSDLDLYREAMAEYMMDLPVWYTDK